MRVCVRACEGHVSVFFAKTHLFEARHCDKNFFFLLLFYFIFFFAWIQNSRGKKSGERAVSCKRECNYAMMEIKGEETPK